MIDNDVLTTVRESLGDVRLDRPLETIVARGKRRRRRRHAATAGTLVVAAGLAATLATGLEGTPDSPEPPLPAAWSVTADRDGTIVARLRRINDIADPNALERSLKAAGAPAIVRTGDCAWPSPADYRGDAFTVTREGEGELIRIIPSRLPAGALVVFAINGQLLPPGTGEPKAKTVTIQVGVTPSAKAVTCQR